MNKNKSQEVYNGNEFWKIKMEELGIEQEKIDELKEAILRQPINNPLNCRMTKDGRLQRRKVA